ncbi:hypothetical protein HanIR_Chr13g0664491 [Helianthus annuus]|nr:hypothetical protein HanIR_Chr13g0664491 [Helianthus annuus]
MRRAPQAKKPTKKHQKCAFWSFPVITQGEKQKSPRPCALRTLFKTKVTKRHNDANIEKTQ